MMNNKNIRILFGIIFLSISLYAFRNYYYYTVSSANNKPISYLYIDKSIHSGGRGESYDMIFKYNSKEESISITSKEYDLIDSAIYPKLYYSKYTDSIYSNWTIKMNMRLALASIIIFILIIIPWNRIINSKNDVKNKNFSKSSPRRRRFR